MASSCVARAAISASAPTPPARRSSAGWSAARAGKSSSPPQRRSRPTRAKVTIAGKEVPATVDKGVIAFEVSISQKDGIRDYQVELAQ